MMTGLKSSVLRLGIAYALAAASIPIGTAEAAPAAKLIVAVDRPGDLAAFEQVQYYYGGRRYCWYDGGWHGPGWYWCGYAYRHGYGWGGVVGWRGWGGGHGGGYRGGGRAVVHGGGGGRGGGGHGGGGHGGGHGGGGHHH